MQNSINVSFKYDSTKKTRCTILEFNNANEELDAKFIGIVYQDRRACLFFAERYEDGNYHLIKNDGRFRTVVSLSNINTIEDFWEEILKCYTIIDFKLNTVLHFRKDYNRYYLYDFDLSDIDLMKKILKVDNVETRCDSVKNLTYIGENSPKGYFVVQTKNGEYIDYTVSEDEIKEIVSKNEQA